MKTEIKTLLVIGLLGITSSSQASDGRFTIRAHCVFTSLSEGSLSLDDKGATKGSSNYSCDNAYENLLSKCKGGSLVRNIKSMEGHSSESREFGVGIGGGFLRRKTFNVQTSRSSESGNAVSFEWLSPPSQDSDCSLDTHYELETVPSLDNLNIGG